MYLFELFDKSPAHEQHRDPKLAEQLLWYILDNDHLHKKYSLAILLSKDLSKIKNYKTWIPMVNAGCVMMYNEHEMSGNPQRHFDSEFRNDVARQIAEIYAEEFNEPNASTEE